MNNSVDSALDRVRDFENSFIQLKIELQVFENLKTNDKIMRDKNTQLLYLEPPGYSQSIKRWWYGETHEKTFIYLDDLFRKLMKFLDTILKYMSGRKYCLRIARLNKQIVLYINSIIPGLCSLKYTYPDYKEIHCKIASIVITLIDYKKAIYKYNQKRPLTSFEI